MVDRWASHVIIEGVWRCTESNAGPAWGRVHRAGLPHKERTGRLGERGEGGEWGGFTVPHVHTWWWGPCSFRAAPGNERVDDTFMDGWRYIWLVNLCAIRLLRAKLSTSHTILDVYYHKGWIHDFFLLWLLFERVSKVTSFCYMVLAHGYFACVKRQPSFTCKCAWSQQCCRVNLVMSFPWILCVPIKEVPRS